MTDRVTANTEVPVVFVIDGDDRAERMLAPIARSLQSRTSYFQSPETFLYSFADGPGCIFFDIEYTLQHGFDFAADLAKRGCRMPMVMLGETPSVESVVAAMELGCLTLLKKPIDEIRAARYLTKALSEDHANRDDFERKQSVRERYDQLTSKEREVIDRILVGSTNREIAKELGISVRAVEDRRSRIMRRMEAASLVQLVDLVRVAESVAEPANESLDLL